MIHPDQQQFAMLSLLFTYPAQRWLDMNELRQSLDETQYVTIRTQVTDFLDYVEQQPLEELAKEYVVTFDLSEESNLDLTSLLCPDDRKRGLVLANLKSIYQQAGLDIDSGELPDYLPMILEFLSVADQDASAAVLEIVRPGMEKLWEQLKKINSPYAGILEACLISTVGIGQGPMVTEGGVS